MKPILQSSGQRRTRGFLQSRGIDNAPVNAKPQGRGVGHGVGILTFSFKRIQIPHPCDKIIGQNVHLAASEGGKMSFVFRREILESIIKLIYPLMRYVIVMS